MEAPLDVISLYQSLMPSTMMRSKGKAKTLRNTLRAPPNTSETCNMRNAPSAIIGYTANTTVRLSSP